MIAEPLVLQDSAAINHNFAKTSLQGMTSEWIDPASNDSVRMAAKIAHRKSGKGGALASSLFQLTRQVKTAQGTWETQTLNLTFTRPTSPTTLVTTDREKIVQMMKDFIDNNEAAFIAWTQLQP